jgi:hypothetical protein
MANLTSRGALLASAHGEFGSVHLRLTLPDGTPVYKAGVHILSRRGREPFAQMFSSDRNGELLLPVPLGTEFTIDVGFKCMATPLAVNTERGIRWSAQADPDVWPKWDDVPSTTEAVLALTLDGANCRP